jgi:hypothetical protein
MSLIETPYRNLSGLPLKLTLVAFPLLSVIKKFAKLAAKEKGSEKILGPF